MALRNETTLILALTLGCTASAEVPESEATSGGESASASTERPSAGADADYAEAGDGAPESASLAAVVGSDPRFTLFTRALETSGLASTLSDEAPLTVFVPTDAAFEALPDGSLEALLQPEKRSELVRVLRHHLVSGEMSASELSDRMQLPTEEGSSVLLRSEGVLRVGDAEVIQPSIEFGNGIIHPIAAVLMPPGM